MAKPRLGKEKAMKLLLRMKKKTDSLLNRKIWSRVDLLFCRNSLIAPYEFTMEKVLFVVRSLKEKLVINLESLLLHGNEDCREQIFNREEKRGKSKNKAHMARKGNPISVSGGMSNFLVRISIVLLLCLVFLSLSYCISMLLVLDFKIQSKVLGVAIRHVFTMLGWPFLGLLLYGLLSGYELNMMGPEGASVAAAPSEPSVNQGEDPATHRNVAGPSHPREYNSLSKSFPSVPSDLPPLPAGSVPSVPSLPSVGSDFEVEQPAPIQPQDAPNEPQAPARHDPAPWEDPFWYIQHQRIKDRIATLTPEREVNDDEIDSIIMLKRGIIDRMAQLDPHPFWAEQKHNLVADGILNKEAEYTMDTLNRNFLLLTTDGEGRGSDSFFFKKLLRIRENFELDG